MDLEKGNSVTRTKVCTRPCLIVTIFLLLIIIIILPFSVLYFQNDKRLKLLADKLNLVMIHSVFMDPNRVQIVNDFVKMKNQTADPCDNFYEYTCGSFDKLALDSDLDKLQSNIKFKIIRLLDKPYKKDSELRAVGMAKSFYRSCMNRIQIEKDGIRLFKEMFSNIGRPLMMFEDWEEELQRGWSLDEAVTKAKMLYDIPLLFDVFVTQDSVDASVHIMGLHVERLQLFDKWIDENDQFKQAYLDFIGGMMGNLTDSEVYLGKLKNVIEFERQIIDTYVPKSLLYTPENYRKMTIKELIAYIPTFDWLKYFQSLPTIPTPSLLSEISTSALEPLQNTFTIIANTSQETLANFVSWSLVKTMVTELELPALYDDIYFNFENATFPADLRAPKLKKCVDNTIENFEFAVARMYTDEHFDQRNKIYAEKMIADFKDEYVRMIEGCDWMDDDTKKYAVKKAKKIRAVVGYSDLLASDSYIDIQHDGLEIDEDKYNDNVLNIKRFDLAQEWKDLHKKPRRELVIGKVEVNAYYSSSRNTIVFPASILQHPVFKWTYPAAVNYGSIGNTIGHELTHAFDTTGREYDVDNNMKDWWTDKTKEAYNKKTECFQHQYNNFPLAYEDLKIDGHMTLGENLADNGGLKAAFRAYTRHLDENGSEEGLDEVPFSNHQLFFLAFSKLFCSRGDKAFLAQSLHLDTHSPSQARINVPLQNLPEFSEAFSCAKGSGMNPMFKCSFW